MRRRMAALFLSSAVHATAVLPSFITMSHSKKPVQIEPGAKKDTACRLRLNTPAADSKPCLEYN